MSFNALNIDFYLCGGINSRGYAPDEQTTALLQELTAILDRLQSDDHEPDLHTIWLSAKRPLSGSIMSNITRKRPMI